MNQKSSQQFLIDGHSLSTEDVYKITKNSEVKIAVTQAVEQKIVNSHTLLQNFVKNHRVIYGVNTGLGGFVNWLIPNENAQELQENLIAAVATNVGTYFDDQIVRATMLSRINSLARGSSAISLENFNKLVRLFNEGIIPCIPSKGSLGASGDLGPLACIALVATGKWKAKYKNEILSGAEVLKKVGMEPMVLSYKEGLSLINGTSAMVGFASLLIEKIISLIKTYDVISCLTFEGLKVKMKPFNPIVHREKPHRGQLVTATNIWR
jgi:histidine ammonia-lyase